MWNGERLEDEVRPEPHELQVAAVQVGPEDLGALGPQARVDAVRGDDEVMSGLQLGERGRLGEEVDPDPELLRPGLEDHQELLAPQRGEAVPARGLDLAAEVDVDVRPAREARGDRREALGIGGLERRERLVGEDDPEPERVVVGVALPHGDLVGRVELGQQDGGVQPARSAADDRDPHARALAVAVAWGAAAGGVSRARAMISRWTSEAPS
jgi:hypothetical protein